MEDLLVLCGFSVNKIRKRLETEMLGYGKILCYEEKRTKPAILDYLNTHHDCRTVILKEYLEDGSRFTAHELVMMNEEVDRNIIIVLQEKHKGTDYVRKLYNAGITGAIFHNQRSSVAPERVVQLACKKRSRKEARIYYGIEEKKADYGYLSYADYEDYYRFLLDEKEGQNYTERFLKIMYCLLPKQAVNFINALPQAMLQELMCYAEFYDVTDELRRLGFRDLKFKRPKKIKRSLSYHDYTAEVEKKMNLGMLLSLKEGSKIPGLLTEKTRLAMIREDYLESARNDRMDEEISSSADQNGFVQPPMTEEEVLVGLEEEETMIGLGDTFPNAAHLEEESVFYSMMEDVFLPDAMPSEEREPYKDCMIDEDSRPKSHQWEEDSTHIMRSDCCGQSEILDILQGRFNREHGNFAMEEKSNSLDIESELRKVVGSNMEKDISLFELFSGI